MIFEFLVRIFGTDILWALGFLSCMLGYQDETFTVSARIRQPVTQKIEQLVKEGLKFRIEQNLTVIINSQNSYTRSLEKNLVWNKGWYVNGSPVPSQNLQSEMGTVTFSFSGFHFDEGDIVLLFCNVRILSDEEFTVSTGLKTQVLWNFYTPSLKKEYLFHNGKFESR